MLSDDLDLERFLLLLAFWSWRL